jgi:hypothetical protein
LSCAMVLRPSLVCVEDKFLHRAGVVAQPEKGQSPKTKHRNETKRTMKKKGRKPKFGGQGVRRAFVHDGERMND